MKKLSTDTKEKTMEEQETIKKKKFKKMEENEIIYHFIIVFNIFDKIFSFFYTNISHTLKYIFKNKNYNLKKFFPITFIFFCFLSLTLGQNISTNLLFKAYLNESKIIHISYDAIIKERLETGEKNHKKNKIYKKLEKIQKNYKILEEFVNTSEEDIYFPFLILSNNILNNFYIFYFYFHNFLFLLFFYSNPLSFQNLIYILNY